MFGTISCGTLRTEDLLEAFTNALDTLLEASANDEPSFVAFVGSCHDFLGEIERGEWADDEDEALSKLFDALQEFAPPFCYFGAIEGDGSDFGFWPDTEALREINHVSDTVELDTMGGGEALHVNDHGNMTLYARTAEGGWDEVWAIV